MATGSQPNEKLVSPVDTHTRLILKYRLHLSQPSIIPSRQIRQRDPVQTARKQSLTRRASHRSSIRSSLGYPSPPSSNEDEAQPTPKSGHYSSLHNSTRSQLADNGIPPRTSSSRNNVEALMTLLAHERARADLAEKQLAKDNEVIVERLRKMHETHLRTEAELIQAKTELSMYKYQLDLAHKEIQRAQVIIDDIERARAEAEDRSIRDREEIQRLVLQRAVEEARQESKKEGWRLGLERGRRYISTIQQEEIRQHRSSQPSPALYRPVHNSIAKFLAHSFTFSRDAPVTPIASNAPHSSSNNAPDNPHKGTLDDSPRTSSDSTFSRGRSKSPSSHSRHRPRSRSPSLAPSRRSLRSHYSVPPEGFIPVLGSDEHITLPPPHEFSAPVDMTEISSQGRPVVQSKASGHGKPVGAPGDKNLQRNEFGGDGESKKKQSSFSHSRSGREEEETPHSVASRASTRISEFDIVGPPTAQISHTSRERIIGEETQSIRYPALGENRNDPVKKPTKSETHLEEGRLARQVQGERVQLADDYRASDEVQRTRVNDVPVTNTIQSFDTKTQRHHVWTTQAPPSPLLSKFYRQPSSLGPDSSSSAPRRTVERSTSNVTVPGIDVEPPSRSPTNTSPGTIIDPVLLTPDHAYRPLPGLETSDQSQSEASTYQHDPVIVHQFPPGFIPFTSVPSPAIAEVKSGSMDSHLKSQEPVYRPRHQIYSGMHPTVMNVHHSVPSANSVLFGFGNTGDQLHARDFSPAPLTRPFSIFSED
ncbi:hypothetical protein H0H92_013871 [Tricholoma furcatifolium]|nr:hypothetical protein H0H92_013871 [Tricholoma furcatifolium]